MLKWLKSLFIKKPAPKKRVKKVKEETYSATPRHDFMIWDNASGTAKGIDKIPAKRPRLYKQATVVTTGELPKLKEKKVATKPGLYANIHAKQERIEKQKASGAKKVETMRKPGTKGAPTAAAFKAAAKTAKKK